MWGASVTDFIQLNLGMSLFSLCVRVCVYVRAPEDGRCTAVLYV